VIVLRHRDDPLRPTGEPGRSATDSSWRRDDLMRRLHMSLGMGRRAVSAALAQDAGKAAAAGAPRSGGRPLVLEKVIAEVAMLMRGAALLRHEDARVGVAIGLTADMVAQQARGERMRVLLCREPMHALEHAAAHLHLSDLGHSDAAFDHYLGKILGNVGGDGVERLPTRALERHWLGQIRCGTVDRLPMDAALLAATCVATPPDLLASTTLDLYLFTHVVLYATDMGQRRARWPRPIAELEADAEAALGVALSVDNFDLAAELLWTWPMLGLPWSPAASFAFQVLASAQDELGFLPGPECTSADLANRCGSELDALVLRTSYHANVAMGLLCAATLQSGHAPSRSIAESQGQAGEVDELLRAWPPSAHRQRWMVRLQELDHRARSTLAPFVLGMVLCRCARGNDLARLHRALEVAAAGRRLDGPAARQALALLQRVNELARMSEPATEPALEAPAS
jgi:hypothetical protein